MTTGIAAGIPGAAGAAAIGLVLREARPSDGAALAALFDRCSPETRAARFHGLLHALPAAYLAEALTASVEIGLLVQDAWQRRALGPLLLTSLAVRAPGRGVRVLRCDVLASRQHLMEVVRRTLGPVAVRREGFEVQVEVPLA